MIALAAADAALERDGVLLCSDVSASFVGGELVAVVGPNGAGKSSLLALLAGDVRPATGSVHLDGRALASVAPLELAQRRAVLTQSYNVAFPFTVEEVVAMGRFPWAHTPSAAADTSIVEASMAACDIAHLAQRRVTKLSGGELARVGLARVIAQETPLLLLDEPTASLDIKHQELVMDLLRRRAASGTLVVIVVHDIEAAASIATRLLLMANGRIVADGAPSEVLSSCLLSEVYEYPISVSTNVTTGLIEVRPDRSRRADGCGTHAPNPPGGETEMPEP